MSPWIHERAAEAEQLTAFRGFSLHAVRESAIELLAHIGRTPPFAEYTAHDISHIDALLDSLEWIVPEGTRDAMTQADCLMTTLACYFHDLGMLVTRAEFDAREESGFPGFREQYLEDVIGPEPSDEFLYQEFVRASHARRVQCWVSGRLDHSLGLSDVAESVLQQLLEPLGPVFRDDLGVVCLSHHLNDLDDLAKYPPHRPYGGSAEETANVQYCAVLLRTADLLHITSDRVPAIRYQLIAPRDPVSQREWAKQQAVRAVRPQRKRDTDGNASSDQPDTIEVHARFTDPEAFFALDQYLNYAREQLKRSHDWCKAAHRSEHVEHEFPWREIDTTGVEAEGFLPREFRFLLDQPSILNLLTGHTLYNESTVAIRELLQNSIDAVRLRRVQGTSGTTPLGEQEVRVSWSPAARLLEVADAGTGMTQAEIEKNFLRVGSSRYQAEEFRKANPDFSAISRFGIGVLSAFMIAEQVDVFTTTGPTDAVRHLKLRDVHGRYLIRELPAGAAAIPDTLGHPGTVVRLKVRPEVELRSPLEVAQHWIVCPDCHVGFVEDGRGAVRIGTSSVADSLAAFISEQGVRTGTADDARADREAVSIRTYSFGSSSLAVAMRWNEYFRTWELVTDLRPRSQVRALSRQLGICVEGVRVESGAPGFASLTDRPNERGAPAGLCNATGTSAPRTNVARSGLERGGAEETLAAEVYQCYRALLDEEFERLTTVEQFSPTRAVAELRLQAGTLLSSGATHQELLERAVATLPLFVVEDDDGRRALSLDQLDTLVPYWTVESSLARSLENLLRSAPAALSLRELAARLEIPVDLPDGAVLASSTYQTPVEAMRDALHEPSALEADASSGRLTVQWSHVVDSSPRWLHSSALAERLERSTRRDPDFRGEVSMAVPLQTIPSALPSSVTAVAIKGRTYVVNDLGLDDVWQLGHASLASRDLDGISEALGVMHLVQTLFRQSNWTKDHHESFREFALRSTPRCSSTTLDRVMGLADHIAQNSKVLNPLSWERREGVGLGSG